MRKPQFYLILFFSLLIFTSGCEYFCDCEKEAICGFNYGAVVFIPDKSGNDQLIAPKFDETTPDGTYQAAPAGLDLDSLTGVINVNNSTIMTEYIVTFTSADGKRICETTVYIEEPLIDECKFNYGDSIFYPSSDKSVAEIVKPVFADSMVADGKFTVAPQGLDLDSKTGYFRVNSSIAGINYTVTYTSADGYTICSTQVIIQGIDLVDAFLLLQEDIQFAVEGVPVLVDSIARPIVGANINTPAPEGAYQSDDPAVVFENPALGTMNLKATLRNIREQLQGDFFSGYSREITINYRIFSNDREVIGNFKFLLYWFAKQDEVPEDLIILMQGKSQYPIVGGKVMIPPPGMPIIGDLSR